MARPHDYTNLAPHPAVSEHYRREKKYGWTTIVADVTCPACKAVRTFPLYTLREQMKRENFSGHCRPCMLKRARAGLVRWHKAHFKDGAKWTTSTGYVMVGIGGISDEFLELFKSMLGNTRAGAIFEHRWVMAKHLGRQIESWECIDHMDGNKTNNDLSNLRIYVRGKNQPGSSNGHGTYYHEWQMALARIKTLESV